MAVDQAADIKTIQESVGSGGGVQLTVPPQPQGVGVQQQQQRPSFVETTHQQKRVHDDEDEEEGEESDGIETAGNAGLTDSDDDYDTESDDDCTKKKSIIKQSISPISSTSEVINQQQQQGNQSMASSSGVVQQGDLMAMMQMIRQQQYGHQTTINDEQLGSPLVRTCSNASSSSSYSTTSSTCSSNSSIAPNNLELFNEQHLKAFILAASNNGNTTTNESTMAAAMAAFADQFAYMVRSRSSSLSDSTTSSSQCSTASSLAASANNLNLTGLMSLCSSKPSINNQHHNEQQHGQVSQLAPPPPPPQTSLPPPPPPPPVTTNDLIKRMLNNYQLPNQEVKSDHSIDTSSSSSPISNRKSSSSSTTSSSSSTSIDKPKDLKQSPIDSDIKSKITALANKSILNGTSPAATPCKVCGDEASGFHYGVDSCEGCKGFFRRCITQGMNHTCTNNNQCEITPFSRNSCQYCRLNKCFAVGMSREASRLGRRPKRAKDEKDPITTQQQQTPVVQLTNSNHTTPHTTPLKHNENSTNKSPFKSSSDCDEKKMLSAQKISKNKEKLNFQQLNNTPQQPMMQRMNLPAQHNNTQLPVQTNQIDNMSSISLSIPQPPFKLDPEAAKSNESSLLQTTTTTAKLSIKPELMMNPKKAMSLKHLAETAAAAEQKNEQFYSKPYQHQQHNHNQHQPASLAQHQKELCQQQIHQIEMLTKLISIADRHTSIERTNELEFIRTSIIDSHCQIWPTTFEKIRRRYVERPPVRAPYRSNSSSSGGDMVLDNFVDAMVPLIMDVVKYCKYIPGFNQINQYDQVQLLKQGSFEVICVNSFMLVDAQNRLMLTPDMEYLMDCDTIKTMPLGFFMSDVFDLGVQVSPLKLTDAEIALFNALLVMNPDRGDLHDKDHIEELQSTMLHVLYKHLKYYRSDEPDLFSKLLKLIPIVQEINRKHSEALNTVKMNQTKQNQQCGPGVSGNGMIMMMTQQQQQPNMVKTLTANYIGSGSPSSSSNSSSISTSPVKTDYEHKLTLNHQQQHLQPQLSHFNHSNNDEMHM